MQIIHFLIGNDILSCNYYCFVGDAFAILPNMLYDRIYVGAKCTEVMSNYFKQFLKVK